MVFFGTSGFFGVLAIIGDKYYDGEFSRGGKIGQPALPHNQPVYNRMGRVNLQWWVEHITHHGLGSKNSLK